MPNIDYSKSAVNLVNPDSVKSLLVIRGIQATSLAEYQGELRKRNGDIFAAINEISEAMDDNTAEIRRAIEADGSYQDLVAGLYGLKQRKVSYTYDPSLFRAKYPEYAPAVLRRVVDEEKLAGLIRGRLITMEDLLQPSPPTELAVATEKPSYVYIIRAGGG